MVKKIEPSERILVRAISTGTYPDPGGVRALLREPGAIFAITNRQHLSSWMQEISADEQAAMTPAPRPVPQTTAPIIPSGMSSTSIL